MDSSPAVQDDSHGSRKAKKEIPAFAGMTARREGMTAERQRMDPSPAAQDDSQERRFLNEEVWC